MRRDLAVTRRELPQFLVQALIQPMFFLLIFCKILPSIGLTTGNFAALMLPGIVGLTELMAAIQGITLPLVLDLGFAREIDDRLLAPMPVWLVAAEKVLFGAVRGMVAGAVIFPAAWWVLGSRYAVRGDRIGILIGMIVLAGFAGSGIGLLIGTVVKPEQISLMFAVILTPLLFTGCTYYPWSALKHHPLVPGDHAVQSADLRRRRAALRHGAAHARPRHAHAAYALGIAGAGRHHRAVLWVRRTYVSVPCNQLIRNFISS